MFSLDNGEVCPGNGLAYCVEGPSIDAGPVHGVVKLVGRRARGDRVWLARL